MPRVSVLQLQAGPGAVQDTLPRIEAALDKAAAEGAVLLVAPELATTGYGAGEELAGLAETADGPLLARLRAAVERTGVALITGFAERAGEQVYNAAVALAPGAAPRVYRKTQLFGPYERGCFAVSPLDADGTIVRVGGLTIGILVCFDVEFPEHVRRLAQAGCDLVAVPTALPDEVPSPFIATMVVPVRAFENQVFVAYADWSGRDDRFGYAGRSCLVGPDGADLARAERTGETLLTADVEPQAYEESRRLCPYIPELRVPAAQAKRAAE